MANDLLAGAAKTNITPGKGVPMGGYGARVEGAKGVHDMLWARALVLSNAQTQVVLVSCDVIGLTADVLQPTRQAIAQDLNIPAHHVMVVCTHTHSGPDTLRLFPKHPPQEYFALLQKQIMRAVEMACALKGPALVGWGRGDVQGISINRRTFEKGPLDTEVGVLRVEDEEHRPIALVTNFACHAVALGGDNLLLSADFPGYAMRLLEMAYPGCLALFTNGAFGNVNTGHRADMPVGDRGVRTFARAEALGHMLAGEVLKVHNAVDCTPDSRLAAQVKPLALPTRKLPEVDMDALRARVAETLQVLDDPLASHDEKVRSQGSSLYDYGLLGLKGTLPPALKTEVMALRIGGGVLAGVPAEYFIEYQIALKQASPHPFTFLAALVNDWVGYVPTREAFDDGGYETKTAAWSKLAPECGDIVYDALLEVTKSV